MRVRERPSTQARVGCRVEGVKRRVEGGGELVKFRLNQWAGMLRVVCCVSCAAHLYATRGRGFGCGFGFSRGRDRGGGFGRGWL